MFMAFGQDIDKQEEARRDKEAAQVAEHPKHT